MLLDEIDYLVTHKQQLLYNFFEWPTRKNSGLVVMGISNTMNLPEQMMSRITSRMGNCYTRRLYSLIGLSRVAFKPYTKQQLEEIIVSRLSGLDAFDSKAVTLCAGKIASLSGDVRRALEVCRY